MHNSKIKRISLAVCFALMPMAASAAGLGKLTVISSLGEPLNAEVELSASQDELSSISAKMASAEIFAEQGLERASSLSGVKIELGKRPDGTPILKLASSQPISDPFLDMLIQVEWSSGRLLREYTALLDPPGYGDKADVSASVAAAPAELPNTSPVKKGAKTKSRQTVETTPASAAAETPGDLTVKRGDTLRAIAMANQVEGVSLEQMLVGLYRANKDAFAGANMNRLKVGQIIHVPPQEELQSVTQQEAAKEIHVQAADWNAYRSKLAGLVAEAAPAQEAAPTQSTSGKITAPAQDKSLPEPNGPRDVVKLSKSESGDVKGRLTALQEEATAREKAIKESSERVAMLEKQLQDMQKLMELKNKTLADAQNAAKPVPAAPVEAAKPAEPTKVVEPTPEQVAPVEEKKPEPPVVASPEQKAKPEVKKAKKKMVRPAPPPPEPGFLDDPLGNPMVLGGLGGLLALVGGAWFYLRNKRRKGLDSFEQGILTSGGLKPNTVFGNTAGGTVDTGNTSFLTDFSQGTASGMIDTNDVDPIAEAEVYMAYGRDVQAEEILKDAIAKEPKRYELHLKLLEIYAGRKDNGAFETLAGEMYASLGASDPTWSKVAEIGRKLEPDNPLYSGDASVAPPVAEKEVDFDATMIQQPPAGDEGAAGIDIGLGGPDTTLDFSLDEAASAPEVAADDGNALDFDIGALEVPSESQPEAAADSLPEIDTSAMDLDLPLGEDTSSAALELPVVEEVTEASGLDFQLDLPEPAAESSLQLDMAELGQAEAVAAGEENVAEISLDLGALDMPESDSDLETSADIEGEVTADLSMPDLELPAAETPAEVSLDATPSLGVEDLAMPSLDLPESDTATDEVSVLDESSSEVSLDLSALESGDVSSETQALDSVQALEMPSLELPETEAASEATTLDSVESLGEISLDLPEVSLEAPAVQELEMEASLELPEAETTEPDAIATEEISLDLPSDEMASDAGISLDVDLGETSPTTDLDELEKTLVLNIPGPEESVADTTAPEAVADPTAVDGLDFDFDVDLGGSDNLEDVPAETPAQGAVPELDLSGISLDVSDGASGIDSASEEITLSSAESPDVDTKLDLVTAYIDMGDAEGARELLQEVLQEGGPAQREKAQKLMESLD